MQSSNIPYSPRIDQLRWLAASIVFLFHFYERYLTAGGAPLASPWFGLVTEGHTGVGLFFTLSGFLFMQIALRQRELVYRDFLRNRLLRILPLFLVVFLVALSIGRDRFQPQDLLYLLASNLGNAPTGLSVVTGAAWCISLEFLFYLLFPFLSRFALLRGPMYLVQLLLLMLFFKVAVYADNPKSTLMYFSTFVGRFDQFLIGMLAAMLHARWRTALARRAFWLLPLEVLLALSNSALQAHLAGFNGTPKSVFWITWSMQESVGWACVIMVWVSVARALPWWLERGLCQGGQISFSFYLLHAGVIQLMFAWGGGALLGSPAGVLALLLTCYAASWALATLSFNAIEAPFLQMRRSYCAATPSRAASVVS